MNNNSIYFRFIFKYFMYFFVSFYVVFSIINALSLLLNYNLFNEDIIDTLIRSLAVPFFMVLIHAYPIYNRMFNDEKTDFTGVVTNKFKSNIEFDKLKGLLKTIYFESKYEEGVDFIKIYNYEGINLGGHVIKVVNKENKLEVTCRNIFPSHQISKVVSKHFRIIEALAQKQNEEYENSH